MTKLEFIALVVVLVLVGALGGYGKGYHSGVVATEAAWNRERVKQAQETQKLEQQFREKEQSWLDASERLQKEKVREISNINARHAALVDSLRQRPERIQVPETAAACAGTTGKELARGDAEFLAGYAADAARLQAALNQCIEQYNQLR